MMRMVRLSITWRHVTIHPVVSCLIASQGFSMSYPSSNPTSASRDIVPHLSNLFFIRPLLLMNFAVHLFPQLLPRRPRPAPLMIESVEKISIAMFSKRFSFAIGESSVSAAEAEQARKIVENFMFTCQVSRKFMSISGWILAYKVRGRTNSAIITSDWVVVMKREVMKREDSQRMRK